MAAKSPTSRKKTAGKKSAPKKASAPKPKPKPKAKAASKPAAKPAAAKAATAAAKPTPAAKTPAVVAKPARPAPSPKPAAKAAPAKAPTKAIAPLRQAPPEPKPVTTARKKAPPAPEPEEAVAPEPAPAEAAPAPRPRGPREPSAHPDAGLSKAQVKKLHARLLEERAAVLHEIRRSVQGAVEEVPMFTESIDQAQHETEQNFRLRLADKQRKLLNEIQAALLKLDEGEYGICEGTEEPIGYARLEVRPWARYSVEYKEMKDRRER